MDVPVHVSGQPPYYLPPTSVNFTEAVGKTVACIYYVDDGPEWQSLEVCFTDNTRLGFNLLPRVRLRADYMESRSGDLEMIRDYGIVQAKDPEDGE